MTGMNAMDSRYSAESLGLKPGDRVGSGSHRGAEHTEKEASSPLDSVLSVPLWLFSVGGMRIGAGDGNRTREDAPNTAHLVLLSLWSPLAVLLNGACFPPSAPIPALDLLWQSFDIIQVSQQNSEDIDRIMRTLEIVQ